MGLKYFRIVVMYAAVKRTSALKPHGEAVGPGEAVEPPAGCVVFINAEGPVLCLPPSLTLSPPLPCWHDS